MKFTYKELGRNRIFGLDLVRSIAVCCVIFAHSGYDHIAGFRYGVIAIEYFFIMSGFLVGEMLVREFHDGADTKTLFNFWIKRWFRTLPLYYLILFIKICFSEPFIGLKAWPYLLFLQNNIGGIDFFAVSWTLVIEEWFYLLMPLVVFLLFRKGITKKRFLTFAVAVVVLENMLRMMYVAWKEVPWGGIVGSFPFRFDSFMIGVLVAFVKVDYDRVFKFLARPLFFLGTLLVFAGYLILFAMSDGGELNGSAWWINTIGFSLTSILMALQMPFLDNSRFLNGISDSNLVRQGLTWISLLSYPMYLIHMDVLGLVNRYLHADSEALRLGLSYLIMIVLSYLLLVFFHQPVTNLRKKFLFK